MEVTDKSEKNKIAGSIFVGCLFVGMAIGMYMGHTTVGVFGGLGAGFLIGAFYRATGK